MTILKKNIYLFGAGIIGRRLSKQIEPHAKIRGFVDNNQQLWGKSIEGYMCYSMEKFISMKNDDDLVVISMNDIQEAKEQLLKLGGKEGRDFLTYEDLYNEIYCRFNAVFMRFTELYVTNLCSLNCKACACLIPYLSHHDDRDVTKIKEDMDLYFSVVDSVGAFNFVGGEALLHKEMEDFIEYYGENYRNKVQTSYIVTNGTHVPSVHRLELLKNYNITVEVSRYNHPLAEKNRDALIRRLHEIGIEYKSRKTDHWRDMYGDYKKDKGRNQEELVKLFKECNQTCRQLYEGRFWYCSTDAAAFRVGITDDENCGSIDLRNSASNRFLKKAILDFDHGNVSGGYVPFCRNCYGSEKVNRRYIPMAEQA